MIAGLIPAAGAGTRLGRGPKAFVRVGGRTLLERAVESLSPFVDEVIVALPRGEAPARSPFPFARSVEGGATRQETVEALLRTTSAEVEVVLVHDAARPFLPGRVVRDVLAAVREMGAATTALPVADTLVRGEAATWHASVPREHLWAVQTPQGFRRDLLLKAHEAARRADFAATDDAGLVARLGHPVRLVEGDARLFKITAPSDLALAEVLAASWNAGSL